MSTRTPADYVDEGWHVIEAPWCEGEVRVRASGAQVVYGVELGQTDDGAWLVAESGEPLWGTGMVELEARWTDGEVFMVLSPHEAQVLANALTIVARKAARLKPTVEHRL